MITGVMLSFARSLGEFGATISFVSNIPVRTQTIPLAMYNFLETPGAEMEAARLCIISIVIALLSLFISEWVSRRMNVNWGSADERVASAVYEDLSSTKLDVSLTATRQGDYRHLWPFWRRQNLIDYRYQRVNFARQRRDNDSGTCVVQPRTRHQSADRKAFGLAMCFRKPDYFHITRCAVI